MDNREKRMSSARSLQFDAKPYNKSFIKIKIKRGPKIDPFRILEVILFQEEKSSDHLIAHLVFGILKNLLKDSTAF